MTSQLNPAAIAELLPLLKARVALMRLSVEEARAAALCRALFDGNNGGPPAQPTNAADPQLAGLLTSEVYGALDPEAQADCLSVACQVDLRSRQLRRPARLSDLDSYGRRRAVRLLAAISKLGNQA